MRRLIAKRKILYLSKEYQLGEELPASDPNIVEAWLQAGSARWDEPMPVIFGKSSGKKGTI